MLKRLTFLRNSLESHDPNQTTQHLRDDGVKKRDERILELWKNDLEKPSVYEMVQNLKKQHDMQNAHSSKFNQMLKSIQSQDNMGDQMMLTKFNNSQAGPPGQLTKYSVDSINDIN